MEFKNKFAENIFRAKYANHKDQTWAEKAKCIVDDVARKYMSNDECDFLEQCIREFKFLPGGRYIYYAGRGAKFWNNCFLLRGEEDTREEWAALAERATSCLMTGGGIGIDYSAFRGEGSPLSRTGGKASGPIPLMYMINEIGRNVMQGGSRRSAIYASLNWCHADAEQFLKVKNWDIQVIGPNGYTHWEGKQYNFNHSAPLDMTNISLNYDDAWLNMQPEPRYKDKTFLENVRQALRTGEPGFSFNFGDKQRETLRNACTEVTSEDDSDVCNLGSINIGAIDSLEEFRQIVGVATKFLVCGTLGAELPYRKVRLVREKNRRLGLGLMGVHEWLLKRGHKYEVNIELRQWLASYSHYSKLSGIKFCDKLGVSRPVAYRAIAPTGTIGILAGTTTGIEPLFAVAYQRRYLMNGTEWKYEYVIDSTAKNLIDEYGLKPDEIETSLDLAYNPERRIKFQAEVQDYVDMAISSTINLPEWGSSFNNEDRVEEFAKTLSQYAPALRGFTCYPDGSRGGQPLTTVPYTEALGKEGIVYEANDQCKGGVCGI
jgi:ribonucleoside-diphosphate reductase alpha chain